MKKFDNYVLYDKDNCAVMPKDFKKYKTENIITTNDKMKDIIDICLRVAKSEAPILISGDSGVGKELLSELIHNNSNRKKESFVKINCAAISDNLKESEFFGYEPGSFTGASKYGKKGIIELSQNGTLFMDEVGEMPLSLQSTLLRVLQDGKFVKVGGYKEIKSNMRIICATNKDLNKLVSDGLFRNDLYFRLNVIPITVPSLSERQDDIPILSLYYVDYFNMQYNTAKKLSRNVIEALISHNWSGNIRELKNTIERLILISINDIITIDDLNYVGSISKKADYVYYANQDINDFEISRPLKEIIENFELDILKKSVEKYGSIRKAAKALGVTPSTISRKLSKNI
nr:sigma 54-interacting transcriptional regulator [Sedimentibacter sp.]